MARGGDGLLRLKEGDAIAPAASAPLSGDGDAAAHDAADTGNPSAEMDPRSKSSADRP
jgi:hypothetical protein